jgi:uncharacterized protein (DUF1697 family)
MTQYLALIRGINVGGNSIVKMAELKEALIGAGFDDVQTYIQSGNVLFGSAETDTAKLSVRIRTIIVDSFAVDAGVVVIASQTWRDIIRNAPDLWGKDQAFKHNLLVMIPPFDMATVLAAFGELNSDTEVIEAGAGVIYQSLSAALRGRATSSTMASKPAYKQMTIRNFNTAHKLLALLEARQV